MVHNEKINDFYIVRERLALSLIGIYYSQMNEKC